MLAFAPSFFANFKLTIVMMMLMCVAALLVSVLFLAAAATGGVWRYLRACRID
jgi:hypothetical protein